MKLSTGWLVALMMLGVAIAGWLAGGFRQSPGASAASPSSVSGSAADPLPSGPGWRVVGEPAFGHGVSTAFENDNDDAGARPDADVPLAVLGTVYQGLTAKTRFEFIRPEGEKNPLRFGRVLAGCDCVEAVLSSRQPTTGESVYLDVALHTGTLSGTKRYRIHAELLDPEPAVVAADIWARVVPPPAPLLLQPPVFSWPGGMVAGAEASVELLNLSGAPVRVTKLVGEGSGFRLKNPAPMVLSPGSSRPIVIVRTDSPGVDGNVIVQTDHPKIAQLEARVSE